MDKAVLISGGTFQDDRGHMAFVNDFDLSEVKRFYITQPSAEMPIRAWQGHKREQKWFYCLEGRFEIHLYQPMDWDKPSDNASHQVFTLTNSESNILHVPGGYINGFKSLKEGSRMMIFSDCTMEESQKDDFRFAIDTWEF